jgi:drug/metabolite transporter (DMT)-like permease
LSDVAIQRRPRLAGIGLMCATVALFACLDTTAKYLNTEMDVLQIAWGRYTSAFLLTLVVSNPIRNPGLLKTGNFRLQLVRSFLLIGSTVLNFMALRWMQLDEVLSITFTFPFIVAMASIPLLGESIGWRRWSAICFGFCGVLVITRPGFGTVHPAALFSLAATLCYGLYAVVTRIVSRTDSNETTLFYANFIGALVMLPIVFFVWQTPERWTQVALLLMMGVLGSVGHFFLIAGHKLAPASVLAPFIYTQLIWVTILGYLVFDHLPNASTLGGATMVVGSGLYMIWRERKLGRTTTSEGVLKGPRD